MKEVECQEEIRTMEKYRTKILCFSVGRQRNDFALKLDTLALKKSGNEAVFLDIKAEVEAKLSEQDFICPPLLYSFLTWASILPLFYPSQEHSKCCSSSNFYFIVH